MPQPFLCSPEEYLREKLASEDFDLLWKLFLFFFVLGISIKDEKISDQIS